MICKFFKTQKGGGVSSINYMLNERVEQGTARVLKGDEFLTRELIKSMTQKHKTCVGVLSFEEKNIDENTKKEIMESFENALLTPAMKGNYNILWIEHTDKGRLELNFIIPKIALESKKAFNPYYHTSDSKRIDLWCDFVNLNHNFSNPKDPRKEQTIQGSKKAKELFKDYESLDKILHRQVADEVINSRDELIYFLKQNNIEVTRKGKDYLSIKLPESKKAKRFKGSIYNEQFTGFTELREIRREKESRAREFKQRDIKAELDRIKPELDKLIRRKDEYYRETFRKINERLQREARKFDRKNGETQLQNTTNEIQNIKLNNEFFNRNANDDDFINACLVSVDKTLSNRRKLNNEITKWKSFSLDTKTTNERTGQSLLFNARLKEIKNDNIRSRINIRNREITREDNRISASRNEITRVYQERKNSIRERFRSYEKQTQWLNTEFQGLERENERNRTLIQARFEAVRDILQSKFTELRERIRNSFKKTINKARQIKRDFGMSR
ncbi:relaxase/mobilization nuclease domain-containing protein [Campylobacter jejuni]|uniref:relaxase/mobilization nuclease domain-containing protein n=1 Tax=Campylobacter jejuni TaxID=197 RepID=UPI0013FB8A71|nr:relaxase/mobilization nuclease domain-containing protein [Campylobacter jejuni]ECL3584067.1 mobilization protein [Campylobacter jejuni]EDP4548347.1 relaxase/mobilization nuclease domain-containing protein [Campylobacter jejuni]MBO7015354.1 relaxase/mobilization nuclease domain-containing protein [Campylobacter jejuni]MBO7022193.1 relaxase/mobilization nuclease domain-containing protein [Campylobacter jejuni]MBO7030313.1 relaxase/mobilization nuclease domain-containing protein [Campylobacter